ncbi:MAG: LysM peptidoglycan-binding domain-containing protein [Cytophagia bacterium]|nr:MAG: LysM peptidoglycan-binding domain-containing protein [Cytophagia bacterium]TAG46323.1 MAG: LysM peptidoglycan-binding domain-containing protein [Cytophagia bacterium]
MKKNLLTLATCFTFCFVFHLQAFDFKNENIVTKDSTQKDSISFLLKNFIPTLDVDMIKDRLACGQRQIKLTYAPDVQKWINFYTVKQRNYTKTILEKSTFYFPIFEEALKRNNMPDELKYLSIVESALTPNAASWAAAVGLWQFIPSTGKRFGLHQDGFIDERMDLYKSTQAACDYLKYLYNYFGDWQLALAAYNCGEGRVGWAVKQAGGKGADFWKIYNFLPLETRGYVPAFIGVTYAMTYHKEHFIFAENEMTFIPSDTIHVNQFVSLDEFAKQIEVPKEELEKLNPHLKRKAVPAYSKNYPIRYPSRKKEHLASNRHAILQASSRASRKDLPYTFYQKNTPTNTTEPKKVKTVDNNNNTIATTTKDKVKITHKVVYGESLGLIAMKYGINTTNLSIWNNLNTGIIHPNQHLDVWVAPTSEQAKLAQNTQKTAPTVASLPTSPNTKKLHTIQYGDNLWDISRKYNVTIESLKKENNITDRTMLAPGQKITVPSK